jgi:hypothetical protein
MRRYQCRQQWNRYAPSALALDKRHDVLVKERDMLLHRSRSAFEELRKIEKSEDTTGRLCRPSYLEKHCRRDVEAVAKFFHLLSVQLPLFLQNQGHNTLAAQVVRKVLLSESVGIY